MNENKWIRLLAYVTGLVNPELLLLNEYLAAENRILRTHLPTRLCLSDPEKIRLGRNREGARPWPKSSVLPSRIPILAWYRRLISQNFDGSKHCRYPGRPRIEPKLEAWIVQMAKENSGWGYERIVGALANLGNEVSDEIVGNAE